MTWRDKLEIGLKEDAPYPRTTCRKVRSAVRRSRQVLVDLPRSRWREGTRTSCNPLCPADDQQKPHESRG